MPSSTPPQELSLRVLLELTRYHIESLPAGAVTDSSVSLGEETLFMELIVRVVRELSAFEDVLFVLVDYMQGYPDFSIAVLRSLTKIAKSVTVASESNLQILKNLVDFTTFIPTIENLKLDGLFVQLDHSANA